MYATADTSTNFSITFSVKKAKKKARISCKRPLICELLERAEMWQGMLDSGEVRTRAEIAERFECAAGRVSNVLNLLKLAPELQEYIRRLPVGAPARILTERGLRELARLSMERQMVIWREDEWRKLRGDRSPTGLRNTPQCRVASCEERT